VLDVARADHADGGSAGLRRFWVLTSGQGGTRTILELKELVKPGTEFGRHAHTLDGPDRFDVLKGFWWGVPDGDDHFRVDLLNAPFVCRDRLTRQNPNPDKMKHGDVKNLIKAEASLLGMKHRKAWGKVKTSKLSDWLEKSAATLTARWRATYAAAGGKAP
jgi:hypothetical protein